MHDHVKVLETHVKSNLDSNFPVQTDTKYATYFWEKTF